LATERVVIDASAGVRASLTDGWPALRRWKLIAPSLFWSEASAGLRQLEYRRDISRREAAAALSLLLAAPVETVPSRELITPAFDLAVQLGWAKTYDAEYVALARQLGAPLLTIDAALAATARRFVAVVP
jgi:predicted nucleic acid-binding protein